MHEGKVLTFFGSVGNKHAGVRSGDEANNVLTCLGEQVYVAGCMTSNQEMVYSLKILVLSPDPQEDPEGGSGEYNCLWWKYSNSPDPLLMCVCSMLRVWE